MYPKIMHIYGPLEINSFNAMIMLGIGVFLYTCLNHPGREKYITKEGFINLVVESAFAGIFGGRLLHIISEWSSYTSVLEMLSIWNGGLSILGALLGVLTYAFLSLKFQKLNVLAILDIAALHAPLLHSLARIGCFLAGCCYGCKTTAPWAVEYTHPLVVAPLYIKIHPTQLYSSLIFLALFFLMNYVASKQYLKLGELSLIYLMGMSLERLLVDFFRGDRILLSHPFLSPLSFHQWVALGIFISSACGLLILRNTKLRAYLPQ